MTQCSPSAMYVREPALYGDVKKQIAKLWGIAARLTHHPAPNPVSLTRECFKLLSSNEYVVSEKTDGVRYLLLISQFSDGKRPFAVLVDRAFKMYQIQICAPAYIYKGSLFDGELVWDNESGFMKFLIFDVVAFAGKSVKSYHLMQRYEIINQTFLSSAEWNKSHIKDYAVAADTASGFAAQKKIVCIPEPNNLLFLYSKPCVPFNLFGSLLRTKTTHASDGFIMTPVRCPVLQNSHQSMFKWKHSPTIDIKVQCNQSYYCSDGGQCVELIHAFPEYTFDFDALNGVLKHRGTDFIIEVTLFEKSAAEFSCRFHRMRTDKKYPNDRRTIANIISEVQQNVSVEELILLSENAVSSAAQ